MSSQNDASRANGSRKTGKPSLRTAPLAKEYEGYAAQLHYRHQQTQQAFERNKFEVEFRGQWDERISWLYIYDDEKRYGPSHAFLANRKLIDMVSERQNKKGTNLSKSELLKLALTATSDAVCPKFTTDAINAVNGSYYASEIAFDESTKLASMFAENRPLNDALGNLMASYAAKDGSIRIKELSSGSRNGHWANAADGMRAGGVKQASLVLSDFIAPTIERPVRDAGFDTSSEQYSLFDDLPVLEVDKRFHVIVATYGFDSVWQPEDVCYRRYGDQWYRCVYRVKVVDWAPRRKELLAAMRANKPLSRATAEDYDGIVIETMLEPVDLSAHPYARYIESSGPIINFPGGLIKRVVNAFETQLSAGGAFISGDTGNFTSTDCYLGESDKGVTGIAARYRPDDYQVAKRVLEEVFGLDVMIMSLQDLAEIFLQDEWQIYATEVECAEMLHNSSNGIMLVKHGRRTPARR